MKILFFLAFAVSASISFGQKLNYIETPKQVPENYKVDYSNEVEKAKLLAKDCGVQDKYLSNIVGELASAKYSSIMYGDIYYNWTEAEEYFNKILKKIIENIEDSMRYAPKIYIERNQTFNASAIHDGTLFLNIGCLEVLSNEAEIAALICHELAHYTKNHLIMEMKSSFDTDLTTIKGIKNRTKYVFATYSNSRSIEAEADSIGFIYYMKTGYDPQSFIELEKKLQKHDKLLERFGYRPDEGKLATHPASESRIKFAERSVARLKDQSGEPFLISEATFNKIKKQAANEVLQIYLDEWEFEFCIEKSFQRYLLDTTDNVAIYYLMESLRRYCFDNESTDEKFIFHLYPNPYQYANDVKAFLLQGSTFYYWTDVISLLFPNEENPNNLVQDKRILERPALVSTNRKAFKYFEQIAKKRKLSEAYLTAGLFHTADFHSIDGIVCLKKYLQADSIKHPEYAKFLIEEKQKPVYPKKTLLIFNYYDFTEYYKQMTVDGYCNYDSLCEEVTKVINAKFPEPLYEFTSYSDLLSKNLSYNSTLEIANLILDCSSLEKNILSDYVNKKCKSYLYYSPDFYYQYFQNPNYESIIFLNIEDIIGITLNGVTEYTSFDRVNIRMRTASKYKLYGDKKKPVRKSVYRTRENEIK